MCTHHTAHITLHTCKIPFHSSKRSWLLWPVMMDESAPTHERRKLVKTYKKCVLPQKRTVAAKVSRETYYKNDKKKDRVKKKTVTNVKN